MMPISISNELKKMDSLQIAEITGKEHKNVLRDIDNLLKQGVNELNFEPVEYTDKKGEKRRCYNLTKKGCLILASGYDALLREKIINRWEELEKKEYFAIPTSFSQALMLAAHQQEQIEEQQKQITSMSAEIVDMKQKTDYVEQIIASKEVVTTTQVAQDYGMSAKAFNVLLRNYKIQHKVNGQWILYAPYISKGYVHSTTIQITRSDGRKDTVMHTEWRQTGRLFLYNFLKDKGLLPLIERENVRQDIS